MLSAMTAQRRKSRTLTGAGWQPGDAELGAQALERAQWDGVDPVGAALGPGNTPAGADLDWTVGEDQPMEEGLRPSAITQGVSFMSGDGDGSDDGSGGFHPRPGRMKSFFKRVFGNN